MLECALRNNPLDDDESKQCWQTIEEKVERRGEERREGQTATDTGYGGRVGFEGSQKAEARWQRRKNSWKNRLECHTSWYEHCSTQHRTVFYGQRSHPHHPSSTLETDAERQRGLWLVTPAISSFFFSLRFSHGFTILSFCESLEKKLFEKYIYIYLRAIFHVTKFQ